MRSLTARFPAIGRGYESRGTGNRNAAGIKGERTSRYLISAQDARQKADAALKTFTHTFRRIPTLVRWTLAYDQGKEVARLQELARRVWMHVYFAGPHDLWQRPGNGNAIDTIESCPWAWICPAISLERFNAIARRLSDRPRKVLDFKTPAIDFQEEILNSKNCVALQLEIALFWYLL